MYYIGIDLGGTNIAVAVVDEKGKMLYKKNTPTLAERHYSEIISDMARLCKEVVKGIDKDLSDTEKRKEFIRQIGNPYLYRQGEYVVKLSFADTDATLTDRLKEYIEHVAAAGLE